MIEVQATLIQETKLKPPWAGTNYTDIVVTCLLDYGEPKAKDAFDTATDADNLVFHELGLKLQSGTGRLITHVIFFVQKV